MPTWQNVSHGENKFTCPFCQNSFVQENVDLLPDNFMLLHQPMFYHDDQLSEELALSLGLKSETKSNQLQYWIFRLLLITYILELIYSYMY